GPGGEDGHGVSLGEEGAGDAEADAAVSAGDECCGHGSLLLGSGGIEGWGRAKCGSLPARVSSRWPWARPGFIWPAPVCLGGFGLAQCVWARPGASKRRCCMQLSPPARTRARSSASRMPYSRLLGKRFPLACFLIDRKSTRLNSS